MAKTIFITGASTGLGKVTAELFHSKGWNVIATMRNPTSANKEKMTFLKLDVTRPSEIEQVVNKAFEIADVDVVFNNAGYGMTSPLELSTDEQIAELINTNLLGVIRVTRAFIPYFRQKGSGVFINTSSVAGVTAFPLSSIYHATKWGLEGFAESMSFELSKFGISIKNILPGGIKTDFVGRSMVLPALDTTPYKQLLDKTDKVFAHFMSPENLVSPESVADVVYQTATDGTDQLRYVKGAGGEQPYEMRQSLGAVAFHQQFEQIFFGEGN
jgi:NAD(P)-dependent dehydrogenase (short-subunit alcohol dehydrogenase family)